MIKKKNKNRLKELAFKAANPKDIELDKIIIKRIDASNVTEEDIDFISLCSLNIKYSKDHPDYLRHIDYDWWTLKNIDIAARHIPDNTKKYFKAYEIERTDIKNVINYSSFSDSEDAPTDLKTKFVYFIAMYDDTYLGACSSIHIAFDLISKHSHHSMLFVKPQYRNLGIGNILHRTNIEFDISKGIETISWSHAGYTKDPSDWSGDLTARLFKKRELLSVRYQVDVRDYIEE